MSAFPDSYQLLANAIINSATKSYKYTLIAMKNGDNSDMALQRRELLEEFFLSDWFTILSNVDGKVLLEKMKKLWYFNMEENL